VGVEQQNSGGPANGAPKGAPSTLSRKPANRAQLYEAAAMAAFAVLMILFVVKITPALVG
jgi:hypothetical protein